MIRFARTALVAALMSLGAASQAAVVISAGSANPYAFNWSLNTAAGTLKGNGSMTVSGFGTSALTVAVMLSNTSSQSNNRLTSFGFGITPDATGVTFSDANDGGMVGASMANIPSLSTIEICAFGGPNCSGGGNGGILGGASDSFSLVLAGQWGSSVSIDPIGFKYQTREGSYEFKITPRNPNEIPEPASLALVGLGLAMTGVGAARRRRCA